MHIRFGTLYKIQQFRKEGASQPSSFTWQDKEQLLNTWISENRNQPTKVSMLSSNRQDILYLDGDDAKRFRNRDPKADLKTLKQTEIEPKAQPAEVIYQEDLHETNYYGRFTIKDVRPL